MTQTTQTEAQRLPEIKDMLNAPQVLNNSDRAFWVLGWDECRAAAKPLIARIAELQQQIAKDDYVLRSSVPERFKGATSPVGAVQGYIAELEHALQQAEAGLEQAVARLGERAVVGDFKTCEVLALEIVRGALQAGGVEPLRKPRFHSASEVPPKHIERLAQKLQELRERTFNIPDSMTLGQAMFALKALKDDAPVLMHRMQDELVQLHKDIERRNRGADAEHPEYIAGELAGIDAALAVLATQAKEVSLETHSVSCMYEYTLARLNLPDSPDMRALFWDAHNALQWDENTDSYLDPALEPHCPLCDRNKAAQAKQGAKRAEAIQAAHNGGCGLCDNACADRADGCRFVHENPSAADMDAAQAKLGEQA